jgi:SNF2 family DNA or RNA helicase
VKKAVVACPSSLVFNWVAEFKKWLGDQRLPVCKVTAGGKGSSDQMLL